MRPVHHLVLAMLVRLIQDGGGTVGLLDAKHLARDDVESLVPGDADVLAHPPVLDVAAARAGRTGSSLRVEIHSLHGIADASG
jgi:hypothetical protein